MNARFPKRSDLTAKSIPSSPTGKGQIEPAKRVRMKAGQIWDVVNYIPLSPKKVIPAKKNQPLSQAPAHLLVS